MIVSRLAAGGNRVPDPRGADRGPRHSARPQPRRPLLVLSADRGTLREEQLAGARVAATPTACVSFDVNYFILGAWARARGARVIDAGAEPAALAIQAQLHGAASEAPGLTSLAFAESLDVGGPDDFFTVRGAAARRARGRHARRAAGVPAAVRMGQQDLQRTVAGDRGRDALGLRCRSPRMPCGSPTRSSAAISSCRATGWSRR